MLKTEQSERNFYNLNGLNGRCANEHCEQLILHIGEIHLYDIYPEELNDEEEMCIATFHLI